MFNRIPIYIFTCVTFVIAVLLNFLFPFAALWMLFMLPLMGLIILYPKWTTANSCALILIITRLVTEYVAFAGKIPIDFVYRLFVTSGVGWVILFTVAFFAEKSNNLFQKLENLSLIDNLTHAYNRWYLELYWERMFTHSVRLNHPLSFLMLDVDRFKYINDTYGHTVGDVVLKKISYLIQKSIKQSDVFVRMGGEEFALLLPGTSFDEAVKRAQNIREMIEKAKFEYHGKIVTVTVSIGVTEYINESLEELIEKSDQALYKAKANGRNQVLAFSDHD